jgi:hypothetical protein
MPTAWDGRRRPPFTAGNISARNASRLDLAVEDANVVYVASDFLCHPVLAVTVAGFPTDRTNWVFSYPG